MLQAETNNQNQQKEMLKLCSEMDKDKWGRPYKFHEETQKSVHAVTNIPQTPEKNCHGSVSIINEVWTNSIR